jgi:hypothetical protein
MNFVDTGRGAVSSYGHQYGKSEGRRNNATTYGSADVM